LQVKFNTLIFAKQIKTNTMAIKQTDIRVSEIEMKLKRIEDRLREIMGEKVTLMFKAQHEDFHPMLLVLKVAALDFETNLLSEQADNIANDYEMIRMLKDSGIELPEEEF
jgi:ABC-type dipeptide/oligopeptide/nickel transport system ATPase component